MKLFTPFDLSKAADDQIVYGIASTAIIDDQPGEWEGRRYEGDVVDPEAIRAALSGYWGNIREMHGEAAGKALDVLVEGDTTYLVAKVVDAGAWSKVKEGVYKGFSIGGRVVKARLEKMGGRIVRRITELLLTEISLVDRPANPQAAILVFKRHPGGDMGEENPTTTTALEEGSALAAVGMLVEKAADATKVVQMIQQLRNEKELAGDLEGAERMTQAIGLMLIGDGVADAGDMEEDIAADEEQDAADLEMAADDSELMAEEEEEAEKGMPMAMAAKAQITKAGRKIAGSRMAIMKQAVMAYLKVLADAGEPDSMKMLKAVEGDSGGLMDTKALISEIKKAMPLETLAQALINLDERTKRLEAQPAPGGPVARFAGQPVTKAMGGVISKGADTNANAATIANLKRMILLEGNPTLQAQYQQQLKALTGE